jgi:hypothetical protein
MRLSQWIDMVLQVIRDTSMAPRETGRLEKQESGSNAPGNVHGSNTWWQGCPGVSCKQVQETTSGIEYTFNKGHTEAFRMQARRFYKRLTATTPPSNSSRAYVEHVGGVYVPADERLPRNSASH